MLVFGARLWPGVLIGAFLANGTTAGSIPTSLAIAAGNTHEALVGCHLANRFASGRGAFERVQDLIRFVVYAGTLGPALSATIGVTSLCRAGFADWAAFPAIWPIWWLGNVVGDVVVVPLLAARTTRREPWRALRSLEVLGIAVSVALIAGIVFSGWMPVASLCLPPLMWAAYRFGPRAAAAAVVAFAIAGVAGTLSGRPIFAARLGDPMLLLAVFIGVLCVASLVLAADVTERRRAEEQLREAHDDLEVRIAERTEDLRREIAERERAEAALRSAHETLLSANRELQRAAEEAAGASRMKSEFLANMSHELRTPLTSVLGYAELMRQGKVSPVSPVQAEFLDEISAAGKRLLAQINSILDLAKVEAGRMVFHPIPVEVAALVYEALNAQRPIIQEKGIAVETQIQAGLPTVEVDPEKLRQVLDNYLSNAFKFTGDGGRITVRAALEGRDRFRLEVEDTGIGIRPEDGHRLFAQFVQLETGLAKKYPGTGLGLALTRKLVEAQGGRVGFRSKPGEGSAFFAELPVRPGLPAPLAPPRPSPAAPRAARVLVVESNPGDREWLAGIVARAGCEFDLAESGAPALALCEQRTYDAITLDLLLPDVPGSEVVERIRAGARNSTVPIIVVSAFVKPGMLEALDVQAFLVKPAAEDELTAHMERVGVPLGTSVLVVDDDPHDLKLMTYVLQEMGYRPIARRDVESGLAAAERSRPGAVILDLTMPGVDGFEFLRRFQVGVGGLRAPVLVWTNKDLTVHERDTLRLAANAVILKGKGTDMLRDELRRSLATPRDGAAVSES
jgi:signal transduction histidine kinase/DNA-binding response OmpR family regulator